MSTQSSGHGTRFYPLFVNMPPRRLRDPACADALIAAGASEANVLLLASEQRNSKRVTEAYKEVTVAVRNVNLANCSLGCPAQGGDRSRSLLVASMSAQEGEDGKLKPKPTFDPAYNVTSEAHHIVPVELFDEEIGLKLCEFGIDLNSAENGVWLPSCDYTSRIPALHKGRTPGAYVEMVERLLSPVRSRNEAINRIKSIRSGLCSGEIQLNASAPRCR